MNPMEESNIDELLNSYLDGELSARQQVEVQRLAAHDAQIARRLADLEKCKVLVGSLPPSEAPAEMLEQIKSTLEKQTLLGQRGEAVESRAGARHLFVRKLVAAAAMLGLVGLLAGVVYSILSGQGTDRPVAEVIWEGPVGDYTLEEAAGEGSAGSGRSPAVSAFDGRVVLRAVDFVAVDAFVNNAIDENVQFKYIVEKKPGSRSTYALSCSREELNRILAELEGVWSRCDSAVFLLRTGLFTEQVEIRGIRPRQIARLLDEDTADGRIRLAKDLAVLNGLDALLPGREVLALFEPAQVDLITIPKPVLTSGEKTAKTSADQSADAADAHLTIVVEAKE